ncbi:MAG: hypothetical protein DWQ04_22750 [Chloroflexi bacterium]|nr:MAG: hypothetical protein DWQ04_22750 [Chloroflexota bacterium]
MESLITHLLTESWQPELMSTCHDYLERVGDVILKYWETAVFVAYELIPETGGVPRNPPICLGNLHHPQESLQILSNVSHTGIITDFIRHGELVSEQDASSWCGLSSPKPDQTDYGQFLKKENVSAFLFLPLQWQQKRLGCIFLNFRDAELLNDSLQKEVEACTAVLSMQLAHVTQRSNTPQSHRKQMAVAHTYYGGAVAMFKGQMDALQTEIETSLGSPLSQTLQEQLTTVKQTVFEVMRNLVIDVSGDVLVDLGTMSLSKALNTTAAALQRAWPVEQKVTIDIPPIPTSIEKQPMPMRQLLYAFVLELLGNSIKHGGPAPYINVDINWDENEVVVQVIDHGYGFDRKNQQFSEHGLGFWQNYIISHLGGEFRVASQLGFGTVVTGKIPILS